MYYTYILRCEDDSVYTGITNDIQRRFRQHCSGKGAKYTRSRKPVKILAVFVSDDRSEASRLEYRIKQLSKKQKEYICENKTLDILENSIDIKKYTYIEGESIGGYP